MAINATAQWEVRTTGNDSNGGGFVPGLASPGTDYSQQDSAQYALTGLTTAAANAIILTASASVDMKDNILQIISGTNFTAGFYQIISVVAGVSITVDRTCTTAAGATGVANIGGAMLTMASFFGSLVGNNTVWIKAGTYTLTTTVNFAVSFSIRGYNSTRSEATALAQGTRPLITTATNSTNLFTRITNTISNIEFVNLEMTNTASTRLGCISFGSGTINGGLFIKCKFNGFSTVFTSVSIPDNVWTFERCWINACTGIGINFPNNGTNKALRLHYTRISNCGAAAIDLSTTALNMTAVNSIFDNNGSHGVAGQANSLSNRNQFFNCIFYKNAGNGFYFTDTTPLALYLGTCFYNCIFYGQTNYGIRASVSTNALPSYSIVSGGANAFGSNSLGDYLQFPTYPDDTSLSADPFTDGANNDFTLNNTAGGGAACKQSGFPTTTIP